MNGKMRLNDTAAVIESKRHSIRAMLHNEETVFSSTDILKACGIKYPIKWVGINRKTSQDLFLNEKLRFPMMTDSGPRAIPMNFSTAKAAAEIVKMTACVGETRDWLLKEVLTYRIPGKAAEAKKEDVPKVGRLYATELNRKIDSLLFELLEIKKMTAAEFELHG